MQLLKDLQQYELISASQQLMPEYFCIQNTHSTNHNFQCIPDLVDIQSTTFLNQLASCIQTSHRKPSPQSFTQQYQISNQIPNLSVPSLGSFNNEATSPSQSSNAQLDLSNLERQTRMRKSVSRNKPAASDQFRVEFTEALRAVLQLFYPHALCYQNISEQQLCQAINEHTKEMNKTKFWREMVNRMPHKTSKQVQDYYAHTYQKALFQKQLSMEDKVTLRNLSALHPEWKPAAVVDAFLETVDGKDYFKHNIMMYIINLRRQDK
ncbi:SANT/Myb_domain [Hexamita inflata]|uniref:SANT/Myb domain n=1 Tax=Hexamita inflata TaxID=28002 RepID=A0AA86USG2_9EUKA|nr:SANT/Myb domain [Hexamita inflata]